jgi:hypothetical protein
VAALIDESLAYVHIVQCHVGLEEEDLEELVVLEEELVEDNE